MNKELEKRSYWELMFGERDEVTDWHRSRKQLYDRRKYIGNLPSYSDSYFQK